MADLKQQLVVELEPRNIAHFKVKLKVKHSILTAGFGASCLGGGGGGAAAAGFGASACAAALGASPVTFSRNNCCPDLTVSPSVTKISSMIP